MSNNIVVAFVSVTAGAAVIAAEAWFVGAGFWTFLGWHLAMMVPASLATWHAVNKGLVMEPKFQMAAAMYWFAMFATFWGVNGAILGVISGAISWMNYQKAKQYC